MLRPVGTIHAPVWCVHVATVWFLWGTGSSRPLGLSRPKFLSVVWGHVRRKSGGTKSATSNQPVSSHLVAGRRVQQPAAQEEQSLSARKICAGGNARRGVRPSPASTTGPSRSRMSPPAFVSPPPVETDHAEEGRRQRQSRLMNSGVHSAVGAPTWGTNHLKIVAATTNHTKIRPSRPAETTLYKWGNVHI